MKLFIPHCRNCTNKMSLNITAHNRSGLRAHFSGSHFNGTCGNCGATYLYNVSEVRAETTANATAGGAAAGGLLGLIGGPLGLIIGGVIGGMIGNANDSEDQRQVDVFNNSF